MPLEESGFIVATLFIALIALLLVVAARRDARIIREQAQSDAARVRAELTSKRDEITRKELALEHREDNLEDKLANLVRRESEVSEIRDQLRQRIADAETELAHIAKLTREQARAIVLEQLRNEEEQAVNTAVRRRLTRAHRESEAAARRVLVDALSRLAVPTSSEFAIEVFELESEDLKGRIIGKEGRNIRTFESVAGVDLIIEDNSLSVKISSFDGERRDVAATALGELLKSGLVTPARIETEVARARETVNSRANDAGYAALEAAGVSDIAPELVHHLGRLRFRSSYTQNVLDHSVETALIAGLLAEELGLDSGLARRAGLLHDIGKALTPAQRGSHASIGAKLVAKHGESQEVINAIAAHHGDEQPSTLEAVLVQIADSVSAARPGARNEEIGNYIQRMTDIEGELLAQHGVTSAVVLAAGHQVRVAVEAGVVGDDELESFTEKLASHLQNTVTVPGEIEITVIREQRVKRTIG